MQKGVSKCSLEGKNGMKKTRKTNSEAYETRMMNKGGEEKNNPDLTTRFSRIS
jgi:hypothetical protein